MKYKELLELYKQNKLNEDVKEQIKADIDKHEAISDYLYEIDSIEGFEKVDIEKSLDIESVADENKKYIKQINKSIRRAFLKMGFISGAIVMVLVLLIIFVLPKAVDKIYYNPLELVGSSKSEPSTNKLSLDMAVYSELFLPGYYRDEVFAESNGYGDYDINIMQTMSYNDSFRNISGKITKGKMTLYDANFLTGPTGNAFVMNEIGIKNVYAGTGAAGSKENSLNMLKELNSDYYYIAYITLDKVMKYDEFKKMCEDNQIPVNWCALSGENADGYFVNDTIGFINATSCGKLNYNKEKYPYLSQFDIAELQDSKGWLDNETMKTRLDSLFRYMDNSDFTKVVGKNNEVNYSELRNSIKKYGINIYGMTVIAKKDEILRISKLDGIHYIYTKAYN